MESFYDTNGNLKPQGSESYRIAKAIYDWKSVRRANQVVEFPPLNQETQELFQAALNEQKSKLNSSLASATTDAEKQSAYESYNRWLDIYTRTIYKQEFYDERQAIIDQIQDILGEQGPQLKTAYESLFNLLLGKKDRDGHYKPSEINDSVRQTAKAIEEEIEIIKAIDKGQSTLSKDQKEELKYLFAQLQDLQSSTNSKYYDETVNSIKASLRTQITTANPTLEVAQIESLVNKAFKQSQWYQDNHITKSRYDKDSQQMVQVYEPLYFWRVTVPNNPAYVETEAPSFYWYTPKVSEQFRNSNYSPGNTTFKEVTSGPYYNNEYTSLTDKQKSALEKVREFYYRSQEGNYAKDKPGDVLPGVYKTGAENAIDVFSMRANPLANIVEETKNFVLGARTAMSGVEETTEEETLDPYGNPIERESRKLFMRYSKPLPIEQQSYDLLRSIGLYAESSARFKSLRNLQSTVLAMEEVYENLSGVKEGGVVRDLIDRQFYGKVVNNPKNVIGKIMNALFNVVGRLAGTKSLAYNLISAPVNQFTGYKNNLIFTKSSGLNYSNYLAAYKETFGLSYDFFTSHNQTGMQPIRMQIIDFFGGTQANYSEDFAKLTSRGLRKYSKFWRAIGTYRDYTEYDIAAMTTFAFLDKYNVTADDGSIYKLKDAFELVDGVLSIKPNIKISPAFLQKVRDEIRLANYRAQGVYDKLGQPTVAKYALVRQLLFLKKWLPMHTKTEWGGSTIHYGSGIKTIGAHRAFGRFLQETFYENGKFWTGYQNLTAAERAGLQQFGLNYGAFVMFANAIGAMSAYMNCEDDGEANWKDYFCFFSKKINNEVEGVFTIWGANEFLFTYLRENANGIGGWEKLGWSLFGPFSVFRKFADFDGGLYSTDPYYKYRPNSYKIDWDRTHPTQAGKPGLQVLGMELLGMRGLSLGLDPQSMDYQNRAFNSYMPKTYTRDLRTRYKENYGGVETMKTRTVGGQLKLQYKKQQKEIQKKMQAYTSSGREVPASLYEELTDLQTRFAKAVSEMDARKDTDKAYTPSLFRPYFLTREGLDITEEF
jgi:NTP pyrophosphatase (non-canonical NTP hydrolase)